MITRQITAANADEKIKQLYETTFPEGERIPWDDLMRLVVEMPLDFTAYYDSDELMEQREQSDTCIDFAESRQNSTESQFIGFTIVYPRKSLTSSSSVTTQPSSSELGRPSLFRPFNWYWYFAVRQELRGKGYGQRILTQLIERYKGQTCVLDMESPTQVCENSDQRKRRHTFYLRNGFRNTNVYRTYNGITMTIMMMGEGTFTMQDWDDITNELKRFWWPEDIKEESCE